MRFFRDRSADTRPDADTARAPDAPDAPDAQGDRAQAAATAPSAAHPDAPASASPGERARPSAPRHRGAPVVEDPPYKDPFAARARLKSYPARGPVRRRIWDLEEDDAARAPADAGPDHGHGDGARDADAEVSASRSRPGDGAHGLPGAPHTAGLEPSDMDDAEARLLSRIRHRADSERGAAPVDGVEGVPDAGGMAVRPDPGPSPSERHVAEARAQIARMSAGEEAALSAAATAPADTPAAGEGAAHHAMGHASGRAAGEAAGRATGRATARAKTRLLGFQARDLAAQDPFARGAVSDAVPAAGPRFPVGWIVVTAGPGLGASFTLQAGVSSIGRGEDQTVRLDFGDTSISRQNHASIAFDDESERFFMGHGGKSNLVRLNDRPVLSTEDLADGDHIRIGETTLRFVALCKDGFSWTAAPRSGSDTGAADVAAE